jgi:hypothetical protein
VKLKSRIQIGLATLGFATASYAMFCAMMTVPGQAISLSPAAHPAAAVGVAAFFTGVHFVIEALNGDR